MSLCVSFFGGCISACATDQAFNQGMAMVDKGADLAQKHGLAYHVSMRWNGNPKVEYTQSVGLNTGVDMELRFDGNAAAGRPLPSTLP